MNNTTAISDTVSIDRLKNNLLASLGITYMVIGTIGTFFNLLLFTRPAFRLLSPCIPYFLASSVSTIPILYSALLSRVSIGFRFTPFYYSQALCKLQIYVSYTSVTLSIWFIVACCWDRSISSSRNVHTRQMSNMRTTRRVIMAIVVIISLTYAEVFYCFQANLVSAPAACSPFNSVCSFIDTCLVFILQLFLPTILLTVSGIKTFLNINKSFRRTRVGVVTITYNGTGANISPIRTTNNSNNTPHNQHILPMLFMQITLLILCTLPYSAFKLYATLTLSINKTNLRRSIENLIFNMTILNYYMDKIFAFYIYTMTSRYFRQLLKRLIQSIHRRCTNTL